MLKCPVCGWQLRKGEFRMGTFACPRCKTLLDLPEFGTREAIPITFVAIIASVLIAYTLGAGTYVLAIGLLLAIPLAFAIFAVYAFIWGTFFPPKVRRHVVGRPDEGTIPHITNPPEPPKEP